MNKWMATPTILLQSSMAAFAGAGKLATIGPINQNIDMNEAYAHLAAHGFIHGGRDCNPASFPCPCSFVLDPS
jgi:hypothetical protein